jgi:hypothetical protein
MDLACKIKVFVVPKSIYILILKFIEMLKQISEVVEVTSWAASANFDRYKLFFDDYVMFSR